MRDPFDAAVDPSTFTPFALDLDGPSLTTFGDDVSLAATGPSLPNARVSALVPLPTPALPAPWRSLVDALETDDASGEAVLSAALRVALATGAARVRCGDATRDLVRLPRGSALYEVGGEVFTAGDVTVTATAARWEAFFAEHPEARAAVTPHGDAGAMRAVVRFALGAPSGDATLRVGDATLDDGVSSLRRHPSASRPLADWIWCGHRVWGYSLLIVTFDATPAEVAAWFAAYGRAIAATPTAEAPSPSPDWEVGVDGASLFVRRSYEQPVSSWQLQWEMHALARALDAPFAVLAWEVTESEMGGLDAWGRDVDSLRAYLDPDADDARRDTLRRWYRAQPERVVEIPRGTPLRADGALLRAVLDALGAADAETTLDALRALARSDARHGFPPRLVLSVDPGGRDDAVWPLLSTLGRALRATMRVLARYRTT